MKFDKVLELAILFCFVGLIGIGCITFMDGYESDDPFQMCGGLALMLIFSGMVYILEQAERNAELESQIEELKTDLALIQNRCDWIEDDICKEYKEE